ncbi:Kinesin light chain 3 [Rhynchospora pubera]|uniref:Kinesin light chain 3 n=1 Tax=Rhynchospora pubera TaxID=906938 RepID=A0AAV8C6N3_9POAL|nr:Kinesin light chain 3 [Rhynchospora pubera]
MAMRRLLPLFRGIRSTPPFTASCSNRVIPSFLSSGSSDFGNNTRKNRNQWRLIAAILFSGQAAVFLMDEKRIAYAQDVSSNKLLSENTQGQGGNQEAYASGLQRVEDGTVVSNEHTIKWRIFTDLGRDLFSKGKLDEAGKAFESALKEARLGFGQRDPHVASSCNNLAELKRVRKKFEEAEPLYLEAISILEDSFGPDDIRVGAALHNLGQFYLAQHKLDEARFSYERALKIKARILGYNNPDYASTVHHLGRVLYLQGKEKDAEALIRESISILEDNGLGESSTCIRRMTTLSQIMLKSNRPADAEMLQRKVLHALELLKGWDSLETAKAAEALALTLQSLGNMKESRELLEKCLEVRKRILSEDHIQVSSTMLHLARLELYDSKCVPLANGKYSETVENLIRAKELLDNSIRIMKATLIKGKRKTDHIHVALLLYLQGLDAVGLLESKRHDMQSKGTAGYPYEVEHALRECISIYNEPHLRSILVNAPDAKAQYLTCLSRLSIMIGESGDEKTRTKELTDLMATANDIKDKFLPKKNTK